MIQNVSNLTKMLPLRSLTMQGAVPWAFQALLKLEKNSTADIMSWLTATR
jgi:hypothetical protein